MKLEMFTDMGTARDIYVTEDKLFVVKKSKKQVGDIQSKVESDIYHNELKLNSKLLPFLCPCNMVEEGLEMPFLSTEVIDNYVGGLSCDYGITIYDFIKYAEINNINIKTTEKEVGLFIEEIAVKYDLYKQDIEDIYAWGFGDEGNLKIYDYGLTNKDFDEYYYTDLGMTKEGFEE